MNGHDVGHIFDTVDTTAFAEEKTRTTSELPAKTLKKEEEKKRQAAEKNDLQDDIGEEGKSKREEKNII